MTDPDLKAAYALASPDDSRRLYAGWAETYDRSFAEATGYRLPEEVASAFAGAGGQGPVLDLGAGTGLCGAALARLGIGPLDATDLSPEMLRVAAAKGIYRSCFAGDMLARLPVADGAYAGVTCAGTFTTGHVGPEALDEVIRTMAPGALAVLSIKATHWDVAGFGAGFSRLSDRITGLHSLERRIFAPGSAGEHADDLSRLAVFRRA
ncbi:class I SAM-dependent DNA methyltransferase [Mesobacterium pallidum]|uniref:class I SAM-dependent DNA methyltransferase n=1 Tax=Mesobacterium pallidum TaxID=2872037 RepID=UPI001EE2E95B|nr:class I SAM-dependent methyltransferase [Mesobacterium pallidum]